MAGSKAGGMEPIYAMKGPVLTIRTVALPSRKRRYCHYLDRKWELPTAEPNLCLYPGSSVEQDNFDFRNYGGHIYRSNAANMWPPSL